jgi:hypothetical protein
MKVSYVVNPPVTSSLFIDTLKDWLYIHFYVFSRPARDRTGNPLSTKLEVCSKHQTSGLGQRVRDSFPSDDINILE